MKEVYRTMAKWPVYLAFFAVAMTAAYFLADALGGNGGIAVGVLCFVCIAYAVGWSIYLRKNVEKSFAALGVEAGNTLSEKMELLPQPYAIISAKGEILWSNVAFRQMVAVYGTDSMQRSINIHDIFPEIPAERTARSVLPEYVHIGTATFRSTISRMSRKVPLSTLFLTDETEHLEIKRELAEQKNVTGLLYIDNYEEVIKSIEVEHQGLLSALVEQKIQRYFQSYGAIVAATQKDHFFISVNAKGLQRMMEDRFSLLEDVKTVRAGNDTPVTASIAFCRIHDSYEENLEETRKAIDLALGRGGDQAVVRTEAGVEYFGGKSIGEGTQTRVKARVKAQALRELMASSDQIFAMGHKNGDNDSLGACVAIYRAAASMNKKVSIVLNDVSFSMKPLLDRFKASDAYPSDMFLTGKQALSQIRDNALVVVVDTNQPSMTECPEILEKARSIVVFDHHRQMAEAIQATLSYVEPYASSACELTTEILQYFGEGVRPRPVEAEAIYAGIVVDTNNFIDRTGVRTFDAASYLKRSGVDLTRVRKLLREDYRSYIVKAETAREAELVLDNYAFSECKAEGLDSPKVVGAQAANELLNIEGVKASFVFTQVKNTVYISARSIDELNVQLVMERIGGGGHLSMAGAQLENTTVAEARTLVKNTLEGMLKEGAL